MYWRNTQLQNIYICCFFWLNFFLLFFFISNNERATTTCSHFETVYMADLLTCESEKFFTNFKKKITHIHTNIQKFNNMTPRARPIFFFRCFCRCYKSFLYFCFVAIFSFHCFTSLSSFLCHFFLFIRFIYKCAYVCFNCYARIFFLCHFIFIIISYQQNE